MKTPQAPADSVAASLDRIRLEPLDRISTTQVADVVRRIVATEPDGPPTLEVAAFGSSI